MGVGFHVTGLIILVVLSLLVVVTVYLCLLCLKGLRPPGLGQVTLNCPHCGAETRADLPTCQECGKDL